MNKTDLILQLTEKLEVFKNNLSSFSENNDIFNKYIDMCNIIMGSDGNVSNLTYFSEIDLDKMFEDIKFDDYNVLKKLKLNQYLSKNGSYGWDENQKNETIGIFKNIKDKLVAKKEEFDELEHYYQLEVSKLESVINSLKNNIINNESYAFLYDYLLKDKEALEKNLDLFVLLSLDYNNSINFKQKLEDEDDEEVIEEVEITDLEFDEVKKIFDKYGYNFLDFSDKKISALIIDHKSTSPREYILKLGNYDNIDAILKLLSDNNIELDIEKQANQLSVIFTLSGAEIVKTIINNIKEDIINDSNYSFDEIFKSFIKRPTMFVHGKKTCGSRKPSIKDSEKSSSSDERTISGIYDNYIQNRKLFIELGVDIISNFLSCPHIFDRKNQTIKKNIEILELYGINKEQYIKSLSCLEVKNYELAFAIDRFIEIGTYNLGLDGYNHLKNNLTRVCNKRECSLLLYQLINASLAGKHIEDLFKIYSKGRMYMAVCAKTIEKYPNDGIYIDGEKQVLKSFPLNNPKGKEVDFESFKINLHKNLFNNYFVRELEKFKGNNLCYNFNGVIISRYKVLRNINILLTNGMVNSYNVLFAVTKDSILTNNHCSLIWGCLHHMLENEPMNYKGGYSR